MASKWNDEFDFDDESSKNKGKKEDKKKNRQSLSNNDFYDLEEDNRNLKLPTIGKNVTPSAQKNTKSSSNLNLQQIYKKKGEVSTTKKEVQKYEDQEYEFQQSLAPNPSTLKQKSPPKNESNKVHSKQNLKNAEQNYEQQFEEENYDQEFQEHQQKKLSPVGYKPKQQRKVPLKNLNIPKPNDKIRKGAESVAKKTQISRQANSRNSARSQSASRAANSNAKQQQKKDQPPNKYTNLAQKACPNYERSVLTEFASDKLVRQNDKIRGMIKRLNDQLNDLINKNIMQLKNKKEEKVVVAEDILKILQEQKNSNQTVYQTTAKQLQRLKGKQGQIREEEFILSLDQKIAQTKQSLSDYAKNITKLKLQVNNEGNKLSKFDKQPPNNTQQINTLKNNVILIKKEEQKNDELLEKLYIKVEELTKKNTQVETKYNQHIENAKTKGLSVQTNPQIIKKGEQMKKKIQNIRQHKSKTEGLYKTKCDLIIYQCDQIRAQIKSVQNTIQSCMMNCEQSQAQIRSLVQKAKKNPKVPQQMISTLQNIITQLQNSTPSNKSKDDEKSLSYPKGAKKYQSQKNVEKIQTQQVKEPQKDKNQDEHNKKPNLFKKKEKQDEKPDERIWKDDKNSQPKKQEKIVVNNPISQLAKFQNKQQVEKKDDQKKKPFVIKKNKQTKPQGSQNTPQAVKQEVKIEKQPQKNQETPNIAPRMMKFKKNKEESIKIQEPPKMQETIQKPSLKIAQKEQQKVQQQVQKPMFAPKRFQLKPKANQESGYTATISQKKQQIKKVEEFKPKGLIIEKDPITETKVQPLKNQEKKIQINEQGQKPKFNLRMRDRQRQSKKQQIKQQENNIPQVIKEVQPKININLNDKAKENNNNPYAVNDPPKREREGPLKKQKISQNVPKTNFNIYDQAEDITNVKEIKIGKQSPPKQPISKQSEEPSLQQLLGIKKKNNGVDEDLILDTKIIGGKQGKNERKKDSNFFGDLQL